MSIVMIAVHPSGVFDTADIRMLEEDSRLGKTIEEFLDTAMVMHEDLEVSPEVTARFMYRPFTGIDPHLLNLAASMAVGNVVIGKCLIALMRDKDHFLDLGEPPAFLIEMFNAGFERSRLWHEAMFSQPVIAKYYEGENPF